MMFDDKAFGLNRARSTHSIRLLHRLIKFDKPEREVIATKLHTKPTKQPKGWKMGSREDEA